MAAPAAPTRLFGKIPFKGNRQEKINSVEHISCTLIFEAWFIWYVAEQFTRSQN